MVENKHIRTLLVITDLFDLNTYWFVKHDIKKERKFFYFVKAIRNIVSYNGVFTVNEVVEELISRKGVFEGAPKGKAKGEVTATIEHLEAEGYICFLPDRDGELTFCNYEHFKQLKDE